jgi:hypothetical protein
MPNDDWRLLAVVMSGRLHPSKRLRSWLLARQLCGSAGVSPYQNAPLILLTQCSSKAVGPARLHPEAAKA